MRRMGSAVTDAAERHSVSVSYYYIPLSIGRCLGVKGEQPGVAATVIPQRVLPLHDAVVCHTNIHET